MRFIRGFVWLILWTCLINIRPDICRRKVFEITRGQLSRTSRRLRLIKLLKFVSFATVVELSFQASSLNIPVVYVLNNSHNVFAVLSVLFAPPVTFLSQSRSSFKLILHARQKFHRILIQYWYVYLLSVLSWSNCSIWVMDKFNWN